MKPWLVLSVGLMAAAAALAAVATLGRSGRESTPAERPLPPVEGEISAEARGELREWLREEAPAR